MERLKGCVVKANYGTDGCARFMDLRLSVELRPSRVEVPHLVEVVCRDLFVVVKFLEYFV